MLLTITNTRAPATDLGYLLHKNPTRAQSFDLPFGKAHVFYPESSPEWCTAALLLEVDPIGLVRGRGSTLGQYVNDRPYAASSFLSVAISRVFGSALSGKSRERPETAEARLPLRARIAVLPCREGEGFLRRLSSSRSGTRCRRSPTPSTGRSRDGARAPTFKPLDFVAWAGAASRSPASSAADGST